MDVPTCTSGPFIQKPAPICSQMRPKCSILNYFPPKCSHQKAVPLGSSEARQARQAGLAWAGVGSASPNRAFWSHLGAYGDCFLMGAFWRQIIQNEARQRLVRLVKGVARLVRGGSVSGFALILNRDVRVASGWSLGSSEARQARQAGLAWAGVGSASPSRAFWSHFGA